MSDQLYPRRTVLKGALTSLAAIPVVAFVGRAQAAGTKLDPADPQAKALGYVADASKIDASNTLYKAGSHCSTCVQWKGAASDAEAACGIFVGKVVPAGGWCKVYAKKP